MFHSPSIFVHFQTHFVATLALGSRPRQGGYKVMGQEGGPRVTSHAPGSAKSVREWTLTLPNELPLWELESQVDSRIFKARLKRLKLIGLKSFLSQPYFGPSVGVKPNTPKVGNLESSGTPKCLELDRKAQNTSHWGVLGVIGKVLKRRYRKWTRIDHLDIFSPSYGQKKGRESNWQFDSRPLKVENRPVPDVRSGSATWSWKALFEGYNFGSDLVPIGGRGEELWSSKVPRLQSGTVSGLPFWESREKVTFRHGCRGESQSIL
jgi:hypothetical protein